MTLIVSVLTEQYVALISDRRITWKQGTRTIRQEDTDTKTFNLFGQFLMGFTGVARVDGWRIERWLMEIFKRVPHEEYFDVLAREISSSFDRLRISGQQPHAFHAVGYARLDAGNRVYPLSITISNSLDERGHFSTDFLGTQFRTHIETLGNRRQLIQSVGFSLRETTTRALAHRIRVATKGDPANPALSVVPLLMALRDTARVSNGGVGKAALFASLPKCAGPSPGMHAGAVDYRHEAASLFLPEAARKADEGTTYMPALFNRQMMMARISIHQGIRTDLIGNREGF